MARPAKTGLEYFPLDVDMEQDDKIFFVEAKHGLIGFAIVVRLFMLIYKEGYFRRYDEEREAFMLAKRFSLDVDVIKNVVNDCINEGLFDKNLYSKHGILTSRGIQKRFLEACRRRKEATIIQEYFLLDSKDYDNIVFETLNPVNDDNNPGKCNSTYTENPQSKVKESKVKKSTKEEVTCPSDEQSFSQKNNTPYQLFVDLYNRHCPMLPPVSQLTDKRKRLIKTAWRRRGDISYWEQVFTKAGGLPFLAGENDRGWVADFNWILEKEHYVSIMEGKYSSKPRRKFQTVSGEYMQQRIAMAMAADEEGEQ